MHLTEAMLHNAEEEVKDLKVETVCCEQPEELIEQLKNRTFDLVFTGDCECRGIILPVTDVRDSDLPE